MESNLLDRMLSAYLEAQTPVTVTLQNKIRVSGRIKAFDSYVIVMEGKNREILYRHAVSCLAAAAAPQEQKRPVANVKAAPARPAPRPAKATSGKIKSPPPSSAVFAASSDTSINTTMKEGLLKWMQEHKSAK